MAAKASPFAEASAREEDRLLFDNTEGLRFDGNGVFVVQDGDEILVGTWLSDENGRRLTVTFNERSTPAIAERIARAVRFKNMAELTPDNDRFVRFVLTDGDGGTDSVVRRIEVATPPVAPVIEFSTEELRINEEAHPTAVDAAVEVDDFDAPHAGDMRLRVSFAEESRREGDELVLLSTD